MSKVQRAKTLQAQVDDATERLLTYQVRLIQLAASQNRVLPVVAEQTAEIEACSVSLVKAAEDLIVVSRSLKEAWILGQVYQKPINVSEDELKRRSVQAAEIVRKIQAGVI